MVYYCNLGRCNVFGGILSICLPVCLYVCMYVCVSVDTCLSDCNTITFESLNVQRLFLVCEYIFRG